MSISKNDLSACKDSTGYRIVKQTARNNAVKYSVEKWNFTVTVTNGIRLVNNFGSWDSVNTYVELKDAFARKEELTSPNPHEIVSSELVG